MTEQGKTKYGPDFRESLRCAQRLWGDEFVVVTDNFKRFNDIFKGACSVCCIPLGVSGLGVARPMSRRKFHAILVDPGTNFGPEHFSAIAYLHEHVRETIK